MSTKPVSPLARRSGPSNLDWIPCPPPSTPASGQPGAASSAPPASERRRIHFAATSVERRSGIYMRLRLRRLDAGPGEPLEEETTSQDLGRNGALVRTSLPVVAGERVELSHPGGSFTARLVVQDVRLGRDNVPRLQLIFVDTDGPESVRRLLREAGVSDVDFPASS